MKPAPLSAAIVRDLRDTLTVTLDLMDERERREAPVTLGLAWDALPGGWTEEQVECLGGAVSEYVRGFHAGLMSSRHRNCKLDEGRCPVCGHTRTLDKAGMMRQHHYLGSAECEGTGRPPVVA